jgi:hypothetical protein
MSNKNQHFVSQTYLRGFGIPQAGEVRAINLFAIGPGRIVEAASIKRQCSSDYFYGKMTPPKTSFNISRRDTAQRWPT